MNGSTTIPQAPSPLSYTSKVDAKGKLLVELAMGTMSIMKQVVNEKRCYVMQQGQRQNLEGEMLNDDSCTTFEELTPVTNLLTSNRLNLSTGKMPML
jgi:hypothetical protein